jgi:hypothetical protein
MRDRGEAGFKQRGRRVRNQPTISEGQERRSQKRFARDACDQMRRKSPERCCQLNWKPARLRHCGFVHEAARSALRQVAIACAELAHCSAGGQVALNIEGVVEGGVGGERPSNVGLEPLGNAGFYADHAEMSHVRSMQDRSGSSAVSGGCRLFAAVPVRGFQTCVVCLWDPAPPHRQ